MNSPETWRLIPRENRSGAENMAIDSFFARNAPSQPILRFYGWDPFAISLGYHQDDDWLDTARMAADGLDVVRRPTGGRAILHGEELTYSVILPVEMAMTQQSTTDLHGRISQCLAEGLQRLGADVELQSVSGDLRRHYRNSPDSATCFSSTTRHELQLEGRKVVGSAQRKFRHAVLQHGSILLGATHRNITRYYRYSEEQKERLSDMLQKKTTELGQHLNPLPDLPEVVDAVTEGFRRGMNCRFVSRELSARELDAARHNLHQFTLNHHDVSPAFSE